MDVCKVKTTNTTAQHWPYLGEILQAQDVVLAIALQHTLAFRCHITVLVMDGGLRH